MMISQSLSERQVIFYVLNLSMPPPGKLLRLSAPAEEVATFFAKMLDHEYTTKEMFRKNFYKDWRKVGSWLLCFL